MKLRYNPNTGGFSPIKEKPPVMAEVVRLCILSVHNGQRVEKVKQEEIPTLNYSTYQLAA